MPSEPTTAGQPGLLEYLGAVERFWLLLRRRGLMVSARDVRQIELWRESGIPARVVCQALLDGVERHRSRNGSDARLPSTLRYFEAVVEEAAQRYRERASVLVPEEMPEGDGQGRAEGVRALTAALVAAGRAEMDPRVRESYRDAYRGLVALQEREDDPSTRGPDLIEALVAIDQRLVDGLLARLGEEERREVRDEAARELGTDEDRLGGRGLAERRRALVEDTLTRRWGLLRLVPAPPRGPRVAGMGWWRPGAEEEE